MADDMKRVGLVFKEDGSVNFIKSLQLVNAELRENYNQFKLTQAQWDSSTTKTQKLRAELEYNSNAYDIQNSKVETLRMQLNELENAEDKDTLAIQRKRAELTKAETSLQTYKNKIEQISNQLQLSGEDITKFGEKVDNVGNKIEKAGKKISAFSSATAIALVASAKTAIDFEDAFAGVEKTVDASDEQLNELRTQIRNLAKEIPATTTEISAVAESAGQLGIKTEDIMNFTEVMINLGVATNLSAEEASSALAKFANVTKMSADDYDRLGSTIVALGNNTATTEADIVSMATRLASTGELAGLSQSQILALAASMSSVGIEAEAGGSAMSKLLKQIQVAVETGGSDLKDFAKVAGMSSKEFQKAFKEDAVKALIAFIKGLNDTERNGKSAISVLDDMEIKEVRLSNTILSLANSSDLMASTVELANDAWEDNTALTNEANKRYGTLKSQLTMALNSIKDMAITLGNKLMPSIQNILTKFNEWINKFSELSDEQVEMILKIGLFITAMGPVITMIGNLTSAVGTTIKVFGTLETALEVASGLTTSTSIGVNALAGVFSAITSPVGIACSVITLGIISIATAAQDTTKQTKEAFENMGNGATDFVKGIESANSHLREFNSTLFVSSEEQQELAVQMQEVQNGITTICKTASDERRGYTQEEIAQLDEYFTKLRDLKNRELEIQASIATAITQQAITNAETFQGSLDEYKIQSQEWINTALQQKDATIAIIQEGTTQEVALLNQKYGDKATMQNEAYAIEYNNIMTQQQEKINAATEEVAKVNEAYANGYLQRSQQNDGWYTTLSEYNKKIEDENTRHEYSLESIRNNGLLTQYNKNGASEDENYRHNNTIKKIWKEMYKNMSDSQEKQLGVWLAQVAQTELYGGKIDDETQKVVDSILDSFDSMPKSTKESMKNAMSPMLTEMENSEPKLYSKALGIANGILNRLNKAFDIHSPSRRTRQIMKFVMQPMEEEMDNGKKKLVDQAEDLANAVTDELNGISGSDIEFNSEINKNGNNISKNEESEKMLQLLLTALNSCKIQLDETNINKILINPLKNAFKEAIKEFIGVIVLDDEKAGEFVVKKMEEEIYG